jgi:hypothetical protein
MSSQKNQLEYEKKWAQALIDYLNLKNNSDYIVTEHDNKSTPQWADVDVEAMSQSKTFPTLYLQLATDSRIDRVFKYNGHSTPVFTSDNILTAIVDKHNRYTKQGKNYSEITLVIQGTMSQSSVPFEFTNQLFNECKKYNFKEIWYLSAPSLVNSGGISHFEDWLIKRIK